MKLKPSHFRNLAQIAFTIEPLLDKEGCTTRYKDLEGKPLCDFLITAINSGSSIEKFARYSIKGGVNTFPFLIEAMTLSNHYKSKKHINFGLLVFMFMAIKARQNSASLTETIDDMHKQLKLSSNLDVRDYMEGWEYNLQTTTQLYKKETTNQSTSYFYEASNLYDLFSRGTKVFSNPKLTGYQFCHEHINNYPLLRLFVSEISDEVGIIHSLEKTYSKIHNTRPELSPGLLSDLVATAVFLHLSFKNPESYIVK